MIIGNKNYEQTVPVEFAHRDAEEFKRYVVNLLGFDPNRIVDLRDAGYTQMRLVFGSQGSHKGKVWRLLKPKRRSDVVVFYSGHGVPGLNDKRGYLMPVDGEPDSAELTGYSLDLLHKNLGKLKARSVTVYVDACFSGDSAAGALFKDASTVRVSAPLPEEGEGRVTLLTAASGKQVASWDRQAKHGLFTNHLLEGLYGRADLDQDGRVTAGEMKTYLDDEMTPVAQRAGREQEAQLSGSEERVLSVARFPARSLRQIRTQGAELEQVRKEKDELRKTKEAVERERQTVGTEGGGTGGGDGAVAGGTGSGEGRGARPSAGGSIQSVRGGVVSMDGGGTCGGVYDGNGIWGRGKR